jgi:hypothetical protein
MWVLWLVPLIFVHELSHAIIGKALGFTIFEINFGTGPHVHRSIIFGIDIQINVWPFAGFTKLATDNVTALRSRFWFAIFAGPGFHFVLMLLLLSVANRNHLTGHLFTPRVLSYPAPLGMLFYSNLFLLINNLYPYRRSTRGGWSESDGSKLGTVPFWNQKQIDAHKSAYVIQNTRNLANKGMFEPALDSYKAALLDAPENLILKYGFGHTLLLMGKYREAVECFRGMLGNADQSGLVHSLMLKNAIAWTNLYLDDADALKEADDISRQNFELAPLVNSYWGTRGATLVATGHLEEGLRLLKPAYKRHSNNESRACTACWLSIAEARLGNQTAAIAWMKKAHKLSPLLPYLTLVHAEVARNSTN